MKSSTARSGVGKGRGRRIGRPPKDLAGDVEDRILDAAERLFLEKGFSTASIDEIAALAPASKPTIYAHFPGKEALFAAVVARIIDGLTDFEGHAPEGRSVQDKLLRLGSEIVERTVGHSVPLFRATIAESQRFPELSRRVHEAARDQGASAVSKLLGDAAVRALRRTQGAVQRQKKRRHRPDFHGSHSAPHAHARADGGGGEGASQGTAVLRARSRQLFPGGL